MRRFTCFALFAAFAFGQSNEPFKPKPPAKVDTALRARIQTFYELHVKGQFRQAEELVADDTKDFFYSSNKPKYLSFEITRIDYSANFTQAKATVLCEQYIMMPGFADRPLKMPTPSTWKLEHGKWYWYVDQDALRNTPWGRMKPGASPGKVVAPPSLPSIPTTAESFYKMVRLDKTAVQLRAGESAEVTIANGAPGPMELSVPEALPGIEAKLDKATVPAGGKATLTLRAAAGAKSGVLNIQVEPILQQLSLQITVVE